MSVGDALWVRIKAYNPRKGYVMRRYGVGNVVFDIERGWYKVNPQLARYLKKVHSRPDEEDSPLAFEVVTAEEAKALEKAERKAAQLRAIAVDPNVVSLANPTDLTSAAVVTDGSGADPLEALEDDEEPAPAPARKRARRARAVAAQS